MATDPKVRGGKPRLSPAWAIATPALLFLTGPPLGWDFVVWFAVVPMMVWTRGGLSLAAESDDASPRSSAASGATNGLEASRNFRRWTRQLAAAVRGRWVWLYVGFVAYWVAVLQGLRHAHPAMISCMAMMALYMALYAPLVVWLARSGLRRSLPLWLAFPAAWLTAELIRNYLLTGISVAMLGHALANRPMLNATADLGGTYVVGSVVLAGNLLVLGLFDALARRSRQWNSFWPAADAPIASRGKQSRAFANLSGNFLNLGPAICASVVALAIVYGWFRSRTDRGVAGPTTARLLLIGRNEAVRYGQSIDREAEIFSNYVTTTRSALARSDRPVDGVVWPESMFSGGSHYPVVTRRMRVPGGIPMTPSEFGRNVFLNERYFTQRSREVDRVLASVNQGRSPTIVAGCGVVQYRGLPKHHSGIVAVRSGRVSHWYAKQHLVMFGEYIPVLPWIPGLRNWIPPMMGITPGERNEPLPVGDVNVLPTICIETAVERVAVNDLADALRRNQRTDAIVTVTNDAWFRGSAIVDHHLRCAQMVAVGCRRPVLSSANGGPTAEIDSCGRVVQRLDHREAGYLAVDIHQRRGQTLYCRWGVSPHVTVALVYLTAIVVVRRRDS